MLSRRVLEGGQCAGEGGGAGAEGGEEGGVAGLDGDDRLVGQVPAAAGHGQRPGSGSTWAGQEADSRYLVTSLAGDPGWPAWAGWPGVTALS